MQYYGAFHKALQEQYGLNGTLQTTLSARKSDKFKSVLNAGKKAFKRLYDKKGYTPDQLFEVEEYRQLVDETSKVLSSAIQYEVSPELQSYLERDAFIFSGLKTHQQLAEARSFLKDEKGDIMPYHKFEQKVTKLNTQYNKNYLEAEYEFAVQSAQSVHQWSNLQSDTERYHLQYRTAADDKVRESHQPLHNITLPKDDPFWSYYYPPNGWRCRCTASEVLARDYKKSDSKNALDLGETSTTHIGKSGKNKLEMFRFNPGKTQTLFPPKNSYQPTKSNIDQEKERRQAKKVVDKQADKHYKPYHPSVLKEYKNGGKIITSNLLDPKASDYKQVYACCDHFAKLGHETEIMPRFDAPMSDRRYPKLYSPLKESKYYGKCPDFRVGDIFYEHEGFKSKKNALYNMFRRGLKQSSFLVFSEDGSSDNHVNKVIKFRIKGGQKINEVWKLSDNGSLRLVYKNENPT